MFSKIYLYSTFYIYIQQYAFSFNFNPNYFHSTKIFVQLQPEKTPFKKIIIQLQPQIISFNNKVPWDIQNMTKLTNGWQMANWEVRKSYNQGKTKFPDIQNIVIQQNSPSLPG